MGKSQRTKGSSGERELFSQLSAELGITINRNLSQTRGGGCDSWWQQTLDQVADNRKPVLFYRKSRRAWRAMFLLSDICSNFSGSDTVDVSFETACLIIRESL